MRSSSISSARHEGRATRRARPPVHRFTSRPLRYSPRVPDTTP
ncbi:NUDIX hydrolase, partial [Streptomyces albidoflavus]